MVQMPFEHHCCQIRWVVLEIGEIWYLWRGRWLKLITTMFPVEDPITVWTGHEAPNNPIQ